MTIAAFTREFVLFGVKQAYACMFGAYLLVVMIVTQYWYPLDSLHRYDFIFLAAVAFQLFLLAFRFETLREALVIVVFHLVATVMEVFKTSDSIASWVYPEDYLFGIGNVPLFAGFMYSAVGSYLTRVWKIFEFRYSVYPSQKLTLLLVALIYANFFTHHYMPDLRWVLLTVTVLLFWRTQVYFRVHRDYRSMPLLLGWLLVALFIWLAENIATYVNIWIYPNQRDEWSLVPLAKLSSWYLLMLLSFVLVTTINRVELHAARR
ncbi:DUF817 domain-containing protein [Marinobacterium rhizophilum]|uniref:DUF817 domain-containing protein n=1 Tax=Marinobacterium rhizophilum TaxID=420402 RepID=A0ABY5HDS9_9GAMM|nr:DUF817 domain-containing protein [Marinobacterium rhizophilum]UTW10254.1 DUF817 domain-containing protein [Marinobacterium rhizophilum]